MKPSGSAPRESELPPRFLSDKEGQYLERKSCFDRRGRKPRPLPLKRVFADIAEALAAFANADGGELVVGLDDDGTPSGLPYTERQIQRLAGTPGDRVTPPLPVSHSLCSAAARTVLLFKVGPSPTTHRTTSGKYLLRVKDQNLPMDADQIAHLKALKRETITEHSIIPGASIEDLDEILVRRVADKLQPGLAVRDALLEFRLAEASNGDLRLSFAALLLFARDPRRWHPKAVVEFIRFEGVKRGHGRGLNIKGRQTIAAPLTELPEKVLAAVKPHIGQRQILHDLFFSERSEYPIRAWEEAVVNAVAHRDYGLRGTPVEIHLYDDRLEVVSPGYPVPPMRVEALRSGGGGHASRNPLIARVLTILGLMREVGEGVPRMFSEMAENGLMPPEFDVRPEGCLTVTLRNTPVWDEETRGWLAGFSDKSLNPNQLRLLVMVRKQGGRFTSAQYQKLSGLDIYAASQDIKDLIRKGVVKLEAKGGRIYALREATVELPHADFALIARSLGEKKGLSNADLRRIWGGDRQSALRRAKRLVLEGWLRAEGERRARRYLAGPKAR